ncbi:hypothetical protein [Herpetosiphon gulosus]|uniref:Uncharacterized protein n=1 Tax=Herpetosiphon gulosus TaxID=1973496 RepID=A0ABP9X616_9CHLR
MRLQGVKININLPFIGNIEGNWEPNQAERNAAWELYVELVTRISAAELKPNEGSLREALTSLYSVFEITRSILRKYGPEIALNSSDNNISLAFIAISILNTVIRPFLAKWHPLLSDYENLRSDGISSLGHENSWDRSDELRQVLNGIRLILIEYTDILAEISGIPSFTSYLD